MNACLSKVSGGLVHARDLIETCHVLQSGLLLDWELSFSNTHYPIAIAFAFAPKLLGSRLRITGSAPATTARALLMVGHVAV